MPQALRDALGPAPLTQGVVARLSGEVQTESSAVFAQSTLHLTDWLALTLGARYQDERREATDSTLALETAGGGTSPGFDFVNDPPFPQPPLTANTSFFSPKVSLSLTPFDVTLFYASWQKANKSGTYNITNITNITDGIEYAEPEEVKAIELGVKSDFLDGLVRFNASVFESKIEDLQVQFISLFNGGAVSLGNAPRAHSWR